MKEVKNTKLIVCYGETKNRIKDFANKLNIDCKVVDNLEEATLEAYNNSSNGDVILLSPACASFDAFPNFMARGNYFKELVNKL